MNAFAVLGLGRDCTDQDVRRAYLELVKKFDPENHPEHFQKISDAYEKIKTAHIRAEYLLFKAGTSEESPFGVLRSHVAWPLNRKPLSYKSLKEFLYACSTK